MEQTETTTQLYPPPPKNRKQKALFIAMGIHLTATKSSGFFTDILKKIYPDLKIIDSTYAWLYIPLLKPDVIFIWQQIFSPEEIDSWKAKNVVIIPMYDACPHTAEFWLKYKTYKVFCFSKTLYDNLTALGMQAFHCQYFIQPNFAQKDFSRRQIFYWERGTVINWQLVRKLIPPEACDGLHFHTSTNIAVHDNVPPTDEDNAAYHITYSDWFEDKSEYKKILDQTTLYIAPRTSEGIGMSFLEAMANGCVVLAYDAPTMNEYITDGENGLLFDEHSGSLELSEGRLEQLAAKSRETATLGRKNWEESVPQILAFIQSPMPQDYRPHLHFKIAAYKTLHTLYLYIKLILLRYVSKISPSKHSV